MADFILLESSEPAHTGLSTLNALSGLISVHLGFLVSRFLRPSE